MKRSSIRSTTALLLLACVGTRALAHNPEDLSGRLVLMPAQTVADEQFAGGCWVRFFDGTEYRGARLVLVGPLDLANMTATGEPWRDWDSVIVGPKAEVTTYNAEDFREPAVTLKGRKSVPDLTHETGRFEDIESVQVSCLAD